MNISDSKKEIRAWIPETMYQAIRDKAVREGVSQSEIIRQLMDRGLGEDAASAATPVLESLLDSILYKYFQGLPQILNQLVVAGFEQRQIGGALAMKMLESSGGLKPDAAGARWMQSFKALASTARQQAAEFFRSLIEEGYIEGPSEVAGSTKPE